MYSNTNKVFCYVHVCIIKYLYQLTEEECETICVTNTQ